MLSVDNGPVLPMAGRAGGQPRTVECASRRSAARRVQAFHGCNCTVHGWMWHFVGAKKDGGMGLIESLMDMRWDILAPNSGSRSRTHELVLWATPPLRPANAPKKKPTTAVATRPWCAGRALETAGTCAKSGDEGCLVLQWNSGKGGR